MSEDDIAIEIHLDVMLAKRKMRAKELAQLIGISEQNLSVLRRGKARGIRFSTLQSICDALNCQPGDLMTCTTSTAQPNID